MQVLKRPVVSELTGLPRSTLYYYIKRNLFPKPVNIGVRSVAWVKEDVESWIREKIEIRDRKSIS